MAEQTPVSSPRVHLVTGGTSGMGLATAQRLLADGDSVVITGRDEVRLEQARAVLAAAAGPSQVFAVQADTSDLHAIDRLADVVQGEIGRLDGLFVNAGVGVFQPLSQVTEGDFDAVVDTNFKGAFFTVQKLLPLFADGAGGSIVLNASWTLHRGMAISPVYSASKAAIHNLARTFASDLAGRGIRVNSVSPGFIDTGMLGGDPATRAGMSSQVPLGRLGTPEEVAEVVRFLLSADASYVNAQDVIVDGGMVRAITAG